MKRIGTAGNNFIDVRSMLIEDISDRPFIATEPKNHLLYRKFLSRGVLRRDRSLLDCSLRLSLIHTADDRFRSFTSQMIFLLKTVKA